MIGSTISHYNIIKKIGEGGMGEVYLAEDTKLKRRVAIKTLPVGPKEDTDRERLIIEAQSAAALNHPNICVVHEILDDQETPCIIMEFVNGQTLGQVIDDFKKDHLAIDAILRYVTQIAEAIGTAHKNQIIHRDIKPDNIILTETDQIKVMDFGLAKLRGSANLTKTSSTIGTLNYMAPEQIEGKDVDQRSDIFSFGVLLYEMLSGEKPFKGDYEASVMYSILNDSPEPSSNHRSDIPAELLHIVNRTLEKNPDDRYQSMDDLLIDLRRLKRDTSKVSDSVSLSDYTPQAPEINFLQKNSKILFGIGAVIILALFITLFFYLSDQDKKSTPWPFSPLLMPVAIKTQNI